MQYLTPAQVSERYSGRIAVRTLANWRSAGTGPRFLRLGGAILYPRDELERWEKRRTVSATNEYRS
ncbi:helix-turn-helix domain-containing protein [Cupriavidus sp. UYPR2.512]|uniref:helix-turn-helix domain-containing protein n=1 Tax=Cupriavidus sp. UYPR2.512 TaxID=1080187 RepID=UPI00035E8497|nr:helix-turn-helix domain-containing protein [Cupriavidus necator]